MDNTTVNELNAFLKGEHMAIDGYEKYIDRVDDSSVKKQLQTIQQDHKQHAVKIAERIQNLGGRPVDSVGLAGRIAETVSNVKDIGMNSTNAILEDAYTGESKGIKMAEEIVKGDLDAESADLIKGILDKDRGHLNTLNTIMNSESNH